MKPAFALLVVLLCGSALRLHADSVPGYQTYDTLVLLQPCTEFAGCIPAGSTNVDPAGALSAQEFFTPCLFYAASSCVSPPNCPNGKLGCTDGGAAAFVIDFIVQSNGTLAGFGEGSSPISSSAGEYWVAPGPWECADPDTPCTSHWEATLAPNEPVSWTAAPNGIYIYTPEPSSLALLGLGLPLAWLLRLRRLPVS
jgi:hypothetical protein